MLKISARHVQNLPQPVLSEWTWHFDNNKDQKYLLDSLSHFDKETWDEQQSWYDCRIHHIDYKQSNSVLPISNLPWENWTFSNLQLWLCQQYLHRYQMQCSRRWNRSQSPKVQLITLGPFSQTLWLVHWICFFSCPTMITCTLLETPLLNINPFIH